MESKERLTVKLDDGRTATYVAGEDYTEYDVRFNSLVIMYKCQVIAFYTLPHVVWMEVVGYRTND